MEHTERITRRQLLGLSAVAAGSLLIPSIAYGSAESEDSPLSTEERTNLSCNFTGQRWQFNCKHREGLFCKISLREFQAGRQPANQN